MRTTAAAVGVAITLFWGCGATQPTTTEQATSSGLPTNSGVTAPTSSDGPIPTDGVLPSGEPLPSGFGELDENGLPAIPPELLNPTRAPLPEPAIDDVDLIGEAMFTPGLEEQAIVSMLKAVGFGLYHDDGTVIRKGTEASPDDFSLSETETYGLVEMLHAQYREGTWMTFREFRDQLVDFGLEATAEELLDAYLTAYASYPDAPMTRIVQSQAFLDVEAEIPPIGIWLLFVDGMIPPNSGDQLLALAGDGFPELARAPRSGGAYSDVQRLMNRPDVRRHQAAAHLRAAIEGASVAITGPTSVHEGHNGPGQPAIYSAAINSRAQLGNSNLCEGGSLGGVTVAWDFDNPLPDHGTTSVGNYGGGLTDGSGRISFTFTPKQEEMQDGPARGRSVRELAHLTASASPRTIGRTMCPGVPVIDNDVSVFHTLQIAVSWHEPKALDVELENTYGIKFINQISGNSELIGQDTFFGRMYEKDDGTWEGMFIGLTDASGDGAFWATNPDCDIRFRGIQVLEVFGEKQPARLPGDPVLTTNGDFLLQFYPAVPPEALAGTPDCPDARHPGSRYAYLPFNEASIWNPDIGLGLQFPDPATNYSIHTYHLVSELSTVTFIRGTDWDVTLHLLEDE